MISCQLKCFIYLSVIIKKQWDTVLQILPFSKKKSDILFDLFSIILYSVTYGVKDDITLCYIEDITVHGRAEIRNFSSSVENISRVSAANE